MDYKECEKCSNKLCICKKLDKDIPDEEMRILKRRRQKNCDLFKYNNRKEY